MGAYTWIVVIVREGVSEVTGFYEHESARVHFETMSNWSEIVPVRSGDRTQGLNPCKTK